jgi:hypothetical protein
MGRKLGRSESSSESELVCESILASASARSAHTSADPLADHCGVRSAVEGLAVGAFVVIARDALEQPARRHCPGNAKRPALGRCERSRCRLPI